MKNKIILSKVDYSKLNSMILNLLDKNDSNLLELNRLNIEIKQAQLVEPKKIAPEYVTMNSIIEVVFSQTGISKTLRLAYPKEGNLNDGRISVLSPLGRALLGSRKGETFSFKDPDGVHTVTIRNVIYQPEANGVDLQ